MYHYETITSHMPCFIQMNKEDSTHFLHLSYDFCTPLFLKKYKNPSNVLTGPKDNLRTGYPLLLAARKEKKNCAWHWGLLVITLIVIVTFNFTQNRVSLEQRNYHYLLTYTKTRRVDQKVFGNVKENFMQRMSLIFACKKIMIVHNVQILY